MYCERGVAIVGRNGQDSTLSSASISLLIQKVQSEAGGVIHTKLSRSLSLPETRTLPTDRYKTELCRQFRESGFCKYGSKCQFAHGRQELRNTSRHPRYKTDLCRTYHTTGICPYGSRCHFIHAEDDLKLSQISQQKQQLMLHQIRQLRAVDHVSTSPPSSVWSYSPSVGYRELARSLGSAGDTPPSSLSSSPPPSSLASSPPLSPTHFLYEETYNSLPARHFSASSPVQQSVPSMVHQASPGQQSVPSMVHQAPPVQQASPVHQVSMVHQASPVQQASPVHQVSMVHQASQVQQASPVHQVQTSLIHQPSMVHQSRPKPLASFADELQRTGHDSFKGDIESDCPMNLPVSTASPLYSLEPVSTASPLYSLEPVSTAGWEDINNKLRLPVFSQLSKD